MAELLQELRVLQTGVQLLAGFLLTLSFQARFATLDDYQTRLYLATVILAPSPRPPSCCPSACTADCSDRA